MRDLHATLPEAETEIKNLPRSIDNMPTKRLYVVTFNSNEIDEKLGFDGFETPIELRIYYPRNPRSGLERVRAALWVRTKRDASGKRRYFAGAGAAGGCGYCKASGAADAAITAAGIKLANGNGKGEAMNIHGAGESMIVEALRAIARAAGYTTFTVVGRA